MLACVYVYVYMYVCIRIRFSIHLFVCLCMYYASSFDFRCLCICLFICQIYHRHMCTGMCVCMCERMHVCVYVCIPTYIHTYVHIHTCLCTQASIEHFIGTTPDRHGTTATISLPFGELWNSSLGLVSLESRDGGKLQWMLKVLHSSNKILTRPATVQHQWL